jgi:hypothetical protein
MKEEVKEIQEKLLEILPASSEPEKFEFVTKAFAP